MPYNISIAFLVAKTKLNVMKNNTIHYILIAQQIKPNHVEKTVEI